MGLLVWCILILIFAAFIFPWWFLPLIIVLTLIFYFLSFSFGNANVSSRKRGPKDDSMPHLQKVKREIEERKRMEAERAKRINHGNTNGETMTKKSNVIRDAAAIAGGAALYHHLTKDHKHDDAKGNISDDIDYIDDDIDLWDAEPEDLYDAGIEDFIYDDDALYYDDDDAQYYNDDSYDDIAAYDDFIASMDDDG